jgi:hypothetical protein
MSDLREKLARMTVQNGASLNEEKIAQQKIADYAKFMSKEKKPVQPQQIFEDPTPPHERQFLREWYKLKMENRRKWGIS